MQEFVYNTKSDNTPQQPQFEPYNIDLTHSNTAGEPFDFTNNLEFANECASRLVVTAQKYNSFTIAANQCGLNLNIIALLVPDKTNPYFLICFNPYIKEYSQKEIVLPESDIFNNNGLLLKIKRPEDITLCYQDYTGQKQEIFFQGLTSRLIQHSLDRMNGIDFKSKLSKWNLNRQITIHTKKQNRQIKILKSVK